MLNFYIYFIVFLYGLIFGSFFNVCIARIPKGLSILYPSSFCPKCRMKIRWYQNVPVLSFLLLGGKCKGCRKTISWIYPIIELITGILAVFTVYHFNIRGGEYWISKAFVYLVFTGGLVILSVIDIDFFIIPDRFTIGGIVVGVILSAIFPHIHGYSFSFDGAVFSFFSAFICFFVLEGVRVIGSFIFKREAMGFGDVKLSGAFGAFLGWKLGLLSIFFGAIIGSVIGIIGVVFHYYKMKMEIPFGPFLAIGAYISLIFGETFLNWYLHTILL